jgi:hypothetical protein
MVGILGHRLPAVKGIGMRTTRSGLVASSRTVPAAGSARPAAAAAYDFCLMYGANRLI